MMPIRLFLPYFVTIRDAKDGKITLYDSNNNPLPKDEAEDIYKHLTSDHINGGAWSWLDAKFVENNGKLEIHTDHRVVNGSLTAGTKETLMDCLREEVYVDLAHTKQGLPIVKSGNQEYKQGKNIYYYYPRDGRVAGFVADSGRAYLDCGGDPSGSLSSLGVVACAEGTRVKN